MLFPVCQEFCRFVVRDDAFLRHDGRIHGEKSVRPFEDATVGTAGKTRGREINKPNAVLLKKSWQLSSRVRIATAGAIICAHDLRHTIPRAPRGKSESPSKEFTIFLGSKSIAKCDVYIRCGNRLIGPCSVDKSGE